MKYNQKFYISKASRCYHIFNLPAFSINNVYVRYYQELYSGILNQFFLSYDIFQTSQAFQKHLRHLCFCIQTWFVLSLFINICCQNICPPGNIVYIYRSCTHFNKVFIVITFKCINRFLPGHFAEQKKAVELWRRY